jgi:hypothetical protein
MKRGFLAVLLVLAVVFPSQAREGFPPASFAQPVQSLQSVDMVVLPPVDTKALRAEDDKAAAEGAKGPARFAAAIPVTLDTGANGTWEVLSDGDRLWRLRVVSPGALSLNFGFSRFHLPDGATVHFYAASSVARGDAWDGPYEAADASPDGQFWTAVIPGDDAVIELRVPAVAAFEPELAVAQVGHDYRGFAGVARALLVPDKMQGDCNNDVVCPEGSPWRNEIRSVAVYSLNGTMSCSGTLVNSHDPVHPPYFLTANHCRVAQGNAASMVLYWNFQSPTCGALSGGSKAQSQSGAEWKANYSISDFCLVSLFHAPSPVYNVYYTGWDSREETRPASAVCIHHPNTDEKAISFCNTPLTLATYLEEPSPGDGTHWRVNHYDDGTTEPGSSGSGLWDPNHRLVGQLHGGPASCTSISSDYFGRLSLSWDGGGVAASRLSTWLDPSGTGGRFIGGRNWNDASTLLGDADTSGVVGSSDLVVIANHILGTHLIRGQALLNADYNYDTRLSVVDLVGVVNVILQGTSLAGGAVDAAGGGPGIGDEAPDANRASFHEGTAGILELGASFDPAGRAVVFTPALPESPTPSESLDGATEAAGTAGPGGAAGVTSTTGTAPSTERSVRPAAFSIVLAADPGIFAPGLLPVRFPAGGGWQGLATTSEDGTVRAVLFDPGAGASGPPPSFALPVTGQAGEVRWAGGDAADGSASALRLEATGFPLQVRSSDERREPAQGMLVVQPNPARGACTLRFSLPVAAEAAFALYDPAGRLVLSRDLGRVAAGAATAELSGRETGALAPGLYFARLTLDGRLAGVARFILTR